MTKKRVFLSKDKKPRLVLRKLWIWNFPGNKIISLIAQTSQMDCKLNKNTLTKYLVRALKVVCYLWINFANNFWYERGNYCFNRRFFAVIGKFIPKIFSNLFVNYSSLHELQTRFLFLPNQLLFGFLMLFVLRFLPYYNSSLSLIVYYHHWQL